MSIKSLFNSLADRADSIGLMPPSANDFDVHSRSYYDVPPIIPGTSVGAFAVNDMANRLLARGATPRYMGMTCAVDPDMVSSKLRYIASAMREAAVEAEMEVVSAQTSFVSTGLPYGVALTITGLGEMTAGGYRSPDCCDEGDVLIISGRVGAHGAALFEARNRSLFIPPVLSDSASLGDIVGSLRRVVAHDLKMLCYPADGIMAAIKEIESATGRKVELDRASVPVASIVAAAAHAIHTSPLELETAAAMLAIVPRDRSEEALAAIRRSRYGSHAAVIGRIN